MRTVEIRCDNCEQKIAHPKTSIQLRTRTVQVQVLGGHGTGGKQAELCDTCLSGVLLAAAAKLRDADIVAFALACSSASFNLAAEFR